MRDKSNWFSFLLFVALILIPVVMFLFLSNGHTDKEATGTSGIRGYGG